MQIGTFLLTESLRIVCVLEWATLKRWSVKAVGSTRDRNAAYAEIVFTENMTFLTNWKKV